MKQRALKNMADSRGVLLRPQDSNAVGGPSSKILGAGRKRISGPEGAKNADALLGARRRGADADPLAKKVKVRLASRCGRRGEVREVAVI